VGCCVSVVFPSAGAHIYVFAVADAHARPVSLEFLGDFWAFFRSEFLVPFLQLFCARFSPLFCLLLRRISGPFFVIYLRPFLGFIRPSFHHFYGHHDAAFLTVGSSRLPISVGSRRGVRLFMSWPFPVHGSWHFHLRRGLSSIGPGRVCLRYVAGVS
jgi:hypothetical protein